MTPGNVLVVEALFLAVGLVSCTEFGWKTSLELKYSDDEDSKALHLLVVVEVFFPLLLGIEL